MLIESRERKRKAEMLTRLHLASARQEAEG
jgi:hypothetical protein